MENEKQTQAINVDANCNEFYNQVQDAIESDLARIKKSVAIVKDLTITNAEIEFETATLYHTQAELLENIIKLENINKTFEAGEREPNK